MKRVTVACSVRMSSVTLMHPANAVGRNEVPFGRDTLVVTSNIVLDRGPGPPWEEEIWRADATYCQTNDYEWCM